MQYWRRWGSACPLVRPGRPPSLGSPTKARRRGCPRAWVLWVWVAFAAWEDSRSTLKQQQPLTPRFLPHSQGRLSLGGKAVAQVAPEQGRELALLGQGPQRIRKSPAPPGLSSRTCALPSLGMALVRQKSGVKPSLGASGAGSRVTSWPVGDVSADGDDQVLSQGQLRRKGDKLPGRAQGCGARGRRERAWLCPGCPWAFRTAQSWGAARPRSPQRWQRRGAGLVAHTTL